MLLFFPSEVSAAVGPTIIGGVDRLLDPGWEVVTATHNRSTFRGSILSEDGSYRPGIDEEMTLKYPLPTGVGGGMGPLLLFGGNPGGGYDVEFAGFIHSLDEAGIKENVEYPIRTQIAAIDYNSLAERRHVAADLPAGTLKSMLAVIVSYLPGVTLDGGQVDGPTLPAQKFDDTKTLAALDSLMTQAGGWVWEVTTDKTLRAYQPGTFPTPFNIDTSTQSKVYGVRVTPIREGYANRVIVRTEHGRRATAEHASAATNPWELLVSAPESTPTPALQTIADSILAITLATLKKVEYKTLERGLRPGQTQVINLPVRNINNTFIIQEVRTRHRGGDTVEQFIERTVTAMEGLTVRSGWRDTYKQWNKGGGPSVAGGWVGFPTIGSTSSYFLGGSAVEFVSSPVPTWVPIQGGATPGTGSAHAQIDTTERGTTAAVVTARVRAIAPGVSVTVRLWDVTDGVSCGQSVAVTPGTDWQTVTFSVTLAAGSHFYELQLLPGSADEPVAGWGYLK